VTEDPVSVDMPTEHKADSCIVWVYVGFPSELFISNSLIKKSMWFHYKNDFVMVLSVESIFQHACLFFWCWVSGHWH